MFRRNFAVSNAVLIVRMSMYQLFGWPKEENKIDASDDRVLVQALHKAFSGIGTDERALVEYLRTKSNAEFKEIVATYENCKCSHLCESR